MERNETPGPREWTKPLLTVLERLTGQYAVLEICKTALGETGPDSVGYYNCRAASFACKCFDLPGS